MTDNGTPTPIAAIAYKKILKTSFGMADLDKAEQAGAIAEPNSIETGPGQVRCLDGTLIRFGNRRNDTHALSLTLPRGRRVRQPLRLSRSGARWYKRMCSIRRKSKNFAATPTDRKR
ncbi:hypothetical protein [Bradyrhizobium sp. S69]|uniref:hypothetical protein n=1 Tax=Bradyrhizobium sp. S69 TaxID=1641856 RepID=UPI00131EC786|nr:hypothetical protein [Bradyrhizobium sp. S69]